MHQVAENAITFEFLFQVRGRTFARLHVIARTFLLSFLCMFDAIEGSRQRSGSQRNLAKLGETDDRRKLEINRLKLET